ncbi:hypothetical protein AVEN_112965-1 [Araneus ventricosus]|uniref:Uncharacterized protein n=1 Tax=Araneus ventricosus TaxID=182803 RepID=A0A4Y2QRU0_ARAVE|nr:hypothetical protein AVEN_190367-1 [Araneus ventricosus]GBN65996.1 hypothetical protein AVEN_1485-1 [Araneus ventricosus]GBN66077.1 hypothetical protein AVEN_112965-1 [Araneus ventricosus]
MPLNDSSCNRSSTEAGVLEDITTTARPLTKEVLGYDGFRGSNGWPEKSKRRHGIISKAISSESEDVDDNENWITIQLREKEEINDDVLIDDFLSFDSEAETSETLIELPILDSVRNKNNTSMNCDEEEDGNDHDTEINKPSYDEMLKSFETIRSGLQFEENSPEGAFDALQRCEMNYERNFYKQKTQTKLTYFISN